VTELLQAVAMLVGWCALFCLLAYALVRNTRQQRWRVTRSIERSKYDEHDKVVFYATKGGKRVKVSSIGVDRTKTTRPNVSFDDAMAEAIAEARVKRDVLNATDRNLEKHG
jgi:uncharacterized protein (DUF58 family)